MCVQRVRALRNTEQAKIWRVLHNLAVCTTRVKMPSISIGIYNYRIVLLRLFFFLLLLDFPVHPPVRSAWAIFFLSVLWETKKYQQLAQLI